MKKLAHTNRKRLFANGESTNIKITFSAGLLLRDLRITNNRSALSAIRPYVTSRLLQVSSADTWRPIIQHCWCLINRQRNWIATSNCWKKNWLQATKWLTCWLNIKCTYWRSISYYTSIRLCCWMLGTAGAEKVRRVPLSNTISQRIEDLSSDIKRSISRTLCCERRWTVCIMGLGPHIQGLPSRYFARKYSSVSVKNLLSPHNIFRTTSQISILPSKGFQRGAAMWK